MAILGTGHSAKKIFCPNCGKERNDFLTIRKTAHSFETIWYCDLCVTKLVVKNLKPICFSDNSDITGGYTTGG